MTDILRDVLPALLTKVSCSRIAFIIDFFLYVSVLDTVLAFVLKDVANDIDYLFAITVAALLDLLGLLKYD
ncbi:hypothetical protein [Stappia sp. TSB10GB4]|uniref:hypothetical protein n=1 Tax=Stappia sp. TSB10GB4 TaxID=2003584 RepID=UPI001AD8B9C2|nr:hypothetical protein [Stappia sp. TSB10GB4]